LCRLLPSFSMPSETLQPVELFMLSRRPFSSPNFTEDPNEWNARLVIVEDIIFHKCISS
jgi:hypothetical protein